jgi:hypothetical protein
MKVAVHIIREDGTGKIKVYEVDDKAFEEYLFQVAPSLEEDWWNLADWIEENGKLCYETSPDYSITLTQI